MEKDRLRALTLRAWTLRMPKRKREEEEEAQLREYWRRFDKNIAIFKKIPAQKWNGAPGQPHQHDFLRDFLDAQSALMDEMDEFEKEIKIKYN